MDVTIVRVSLSATGAVILGESQSTPHLAE